MKVERQSKSEKNIGCEREEKQENRWKTNEKNTRVVREEIEVEKAGNLWKGLK